jgi:hypothetical protein
LQSWPSGYAVLAATPRYTRDSAFALEELDDPLRPCVRLPALGAAFVGAATDSPREEHQQQRDDDHCTGTG